MHGVLPLDLLLINCLSTISFLTEPLVFDVKLQEHRGMDQDSGQDQAYQERLLPNRIEISIIVPVYNNPQDLEDCLSALLNTSGPDSELIVVDDGSTDNTASVGERMGVKLLRLAENSGVAAARNYGASQARGEILFFVDADVVVARGTVERIVKVMQENQNLAAVFGSYDAQPRARLGFPISKSAASFCSPEQQSRGLHLLGGMRRYPPLGISENSRV
jgi:glycosyltransferase involved in cell wall biosynthesis